MHNFGLQNLKFQHLINEMDINLWSWNFASIEDIIRNVIQWYICQNSYPTKRYLVKVVTIGYKIVYN